MKRSAQPPRKTPLRLNAPLKRTRGLRRQAAAKSQPVHERYPDCHGRYFDELPSLLPKTKSKWPRFVQRTNAAARYEYRKMHSGKPCAICNREMWQKDERGEYVGETELHHIFAGVGRKTDDLAVMLMVCRACHTRVQSDPACYPEVLRAKWRVDRDTCCCWMTLVICHGSHFGFTSLD